MRPAYPPHVSGCAGSAVSLPPHPFSLLLAHHGGPRESLQLSGWAQEGVTGAAGCSGVREGPVLGQLDRWGRAWVFTGICPEKGECQPPSSKDALRDILPPAGMLTIRAGLMASVAWRSSEQSREGWHAGVPSAHQQLFYAWHLPLQCVGAAWDFGEGQRPSWGYPWQGLQTQRLGLGEILAGGSTAAVVWGREGPDATVQGSSQGATGCRGEDTQKYEARALCSLSQL